MKFHIDDLLVIFPYPKIYPEQYAYMGDLKRTLDAGGNCVLEMPSRAGKTISLLSLIVAYQQHTQTHRKLIYCCRTMSEIENALMELKALMKYRAIELGRDEGFRGLGVTSRKNFCLHPSMKKEKSGNEVDARCQSLTAGFDKEKKAQGEDIRTCIYHDNLGRLEPHNLIPNGIWTLGDLLSYGEAHKQCPYFTSRRMTQYCNVIIYSHHYLLDPKIAEIVSRELSADCIVVFDEAHNIDNVCTESLSSDINEDILSRATRSVENIGRKVDKMELSDASELENEYRNLVEGLVNVSEQRQEDDFLESPVLPDDLLQEAIPGNIRRARHFVVFLKRFIEYLKIRMKVPQVVSETTTSFLAHLKEHAFIERKPLRFCATRLAFLTRTLEVNDTTEDDQSLQAIASFATLVSTYDKEFLLILEPCPSDVADIPDPVLHFVCLDAAIATRPVFQKFHSVIITSSTLSPLDMYPKLLDFTALLQKSYTTTKARRSFLPMVVNRGDDQVALTTTFQARTSNDASIVRNYGRLVAEFAKTTPDGIVVFFPSYLYMESMISAWQGMEILDEIWHYKLILAETPDAHESSQALETYRTACMNGRGAVFFCVARGKVAEGIDFEHQYGRCVICIGIPFQYTESRILKARLEFLREVYGIREKKFLSFDAMRYTAQCLGRVIRGKDDYGIMVLADHRFEKKKDQLPKWFSHGLVDANTNLSTGMAISRAQRFLREMAQPLEAEDQKRVSPWSLQDLLEYQEDIAKRARVGVSTLGDEGISTGQK